ncbi:MAG: hypothetical protein V4671_11165 [Armatimonadota bacterium]
MPDLVIYVEGGIVQAIATALPNADDLNILVVDEDKGSETRLSASWPWVISLDALRVHHPEIWKAAADADDS